MTAENTSIWEPVLQNLHLFFFGTVPIWDNLQNWLADIQKHEPIWSEP